MEAVYKHVITPYLEAKLGEKEKTPNVQALIRSAGKRISRLYVFCETSSSASVRDTELEQKIFDRFHKELSRIQDGQLGL